MKLLFLTFFLPLGLTLMVMVGAVWLLRREAPRARRTLACVVVSCIVLYVCSTPWMGRTLGMAVTSMMESPNMAPEDAQVIVVLTGGMVNTGPVGWLPSKQSYQRLAVGYELQRLLGGRIPVIVSGGHTRGVLAPSEARVTADFFAATRAQITPTELEETSTDTFESAMQLAPVLAKREWRNVFLVTEDLHMPRALATYRARGIDAVAFPALTLMGGAYGLESVFPSVVGLEVTSKALYEIYGMIAYLVSGRIGWSDLFYHTETATF